MIILKKFIFLMSFAVLTFSCKTNTNAFDASGTFEADEIIVSAEQNGKIIELNIEEGQTINDNDTIGRIDVSSLEIQKDLNLATMDAIKDKTNSAVPQIEILTSQLATQLAQVATLNQQREVLNKEVNRVQQLVNADAIPTKQLDDINGQMSVLIKQINTANEQVKVVKAQINAAKQQVSIQNKGILSELSPAAQRVASITDMIRRGTIVNTFAGTVLTQYAHAGEFAAIGKPLYKIADLSKITLRAYITGNQLPIVKLNQNVTVRTDDGNGGFKAVDGLISWISSKSEFTPKTIQTKDERANLVYAIKVAIKNDGYYKIGMYGEVILEKSTEK